jgi:hypothetical protein
MKIAKWVEQADGSFAWVIDGRTLGVVHTVDGPWHTKWYGEYSDGGYSLLRDDFRTAYDACLAAEKHWPPSSRQFNGWLESKNSGYFRKFTNGRAVYVRKAADGWYAVRTDGKVLGKGEKVSWFTTAMDACAAVEKELYTPVDADPFVSRPENWHWIKPKMRAA